VVVKSLEQEQFGITVLPRTNSGDQAHRLQIAFGKICKYKTWFNYCANDDFVVV